MARSRKSRAASPRLLTSRGPVKMNAKGQLSLRKERRR